MRTLELETFDRFDSLFIAPHADDVLLSCPARLRAEVARGHRALVIGLFEAASEREESVRRLGASYVGAGLPPVRARRSEFAPASATDERGPEDEDTVIAAAHLLAEIGPRMRATQIHAPLGLGATIDNDVAYEAAVRAFASEGGRNLFLFEERPEAFVPGAVRTRLALLGARLPPEGVGSVPRAGLLRALWRANEPRRLRAEAGGIKDRLTALGAARRRWRAARVWNPLRAFGPRLQPIVLTADDDALERLREVVEAVLPRDRKDRPRAAQRFSARAAVAAKRMGAAHYAERVWLLLPSSDGLPEALHPLDVGEVAS